MGRTYPGLLHGLGKAVLEAEGKVDAQEGYWSSVPDETEEGAVLSGVSGARRG